MGSVFRRKMLVEGSSKSSSEFCRDDSSFRRSDNCDALSDACDDDAEGSLPKSSLSIASPVFLIVEVVVLTDSDELEIVGILISSTN